MLESDALAKLDMWLVSPSGVDDTLPWLAVIRDSAVYRTYVIDVANAAGCSQSDVERYVDRFVESRQQRKSDAYARLNNKLHAMGVAYDKTGSSYQGSNYSNGYGQSSGYGMNGGYNQGGYGQSGYPSGYGQNNGYRSSNDPFDALNQTVVSDYEGSPCDFCGTPCRMRMQKKLTTGGIMLVVVLGMLCLPLVIIPIMFMRKAVAEEFCPRCGSVNSINGRRIR